MNSHDPVCLSVEAGRRPGCICTYLQQARADERKRIAREIEALPYDTRTGKREVGGLITFERAQAYARCAGIARQGTADE